jgi:hypothetical protein
MADGASAVYAAVSIGGTAALIKGARTTRKALIVQNVHASQSLYIGSDASVTTSNGLHVAAGDSILVPFQGTVYGIASGAATDIRYFEVF